MRHNKKFAWCRLWPLHVFPILIWQTMLWLKTKNPNRGTIYGSKYWHNYHLILSFISYWIPYHSYLDRFKSYIGGTIKGLSYHKENSKQYEKCEQQNLVSWFQFGVMFLNNIGHQQQKHYLSNFLEKRSSTLVSVSS